MSISDQVATVRRFNRFYTRAIGVLGDGILHSPYSLAEVRVLYELAHRDDPTARELAADPGIDAGYLSRILKRFTALGFVEQTRSPADGRQRLLRLTTAGRTAFEPLDAAARDDVAAMLGRLPERERERLVGALATVERALGGAASESPSVRLRAPRSGDLGWVVQRHGALYAREYGWNERFEALVASIVAGFVESFDERRERCWIAELEGEPVGSVFLVRVSDDVAKLRLLLVEPGARGHGIGSRLVAECERFARRAGYRTITLWTNSVLVDARRIYERAGYRLAASEPIHDFGHDLVSETWELDLAASPQAATAS